MGRLVLKRSPGEAIILRFADLTARVVVNSWEGRQVRLAIEAPPEVQVHREELSGRRHGPMPAAEGTCAHCGREVGAGHEPGCVYWRPSS